ncbi:DUF2059 domain-containing protein [Acidisphaera rubrifaciens]|uniref:DUF2059 domain-containing protein n=1 Tax=Acidisphaera rubrifaciens HS-AP3 TaxID=1231350 RepID=A0A0D6P518_9PROT|nr:DUF2059 domain-containing protein [Acidisphaera rubrifaciens]GAN76288.1 hypothetical protein Asru_0083_05 [Acidisphaera rubrifaciens HS-AP3]
MTGRLAALLGAACIVLPLQAAVPAGHAAAAPGDDAAARLRVAQDIVRRNGFADAYAQTLDLMRATLAQKVMRMTNRSKPEAEGIVDNILLPALRAHVDELRDAMADIYADDFTLDELRQVRAFYQTAVGHKVAQVYPDMMIRMAAAQHAWWQRVTRAAMAAHPGLMPTPGDKL